MNGEALTCCDVVVELRGFEPLTPCMPCHPHHFTRPSAASLGTTSVLLGEVEARGAVVRREAACGIAADNLLTTGTSSPSIGRTPVRAWTTMADRCSFCGSTDGPFTKVEGLFTVLMCADCQAARGHGSGPYPVMTRAEMRAGLDLMPTWALEQKATANRQVIAIMRQRLAAGEQVARMYQEPGLAWLERQAEVAEDLVARRKPTDDRPGS
jgi:hypothetical protein